MAADAAPLRAETLKAAVFDAYGTLFDVASAARRLAETPECDPRLRERWPALAETWRAKQLEYCWLRGLSGDYVDFEQVTRDGLAYALELRGLADAGLTEPLMALYMTLDAYPEAPTALAALADKGLGLGILSNGSPAMLDAATRSSGLAPLMNAVLSVDPLRTFKPAPEVYALATERFAAERSEILFVSSNGWDVCSAAAYGFTAVWVNRAGAPIDRLAARPVAVISDLSGLAPLLEPPLAPVSEL